VSSLFIASASAIGAPQVVFVALFAEVVLLCVRTLGHTLGVTLSRAVSNMLDASIVVLFLLFVVLIIVRFKTVG
jgi:hypothetical protein